MLNALTIDVEDYFHTEAMSAAVTRDQWDVQPSRVERSTNELFELFDRLGIRTTMFFLGWVAERFPALVRQAAKAGHELGCHSYWHRAVFRLTPAEFHEDTARAKKAIEDAGGAAVLGYRAPSFSLIPGTEWAVEILADLGFTYDSSVNPIRHDFYGNAGAPRHPHKVAGGALWELPIATVRIAGQNLPVGGGAYLRIFPYAYSKWGLERLNRGEKMPAMFYLHPWEIDPGQPRLPVGAKSRLRQYTNLDAMRGKLEALLRAFPFGPALEAFPQVASPPKVESKEPSATA